MIVTVTVMQAGLVIIQIYFTLSYLQTKPTTIVHPSTAHFAGVGRPATTVLGLLFGIQVVIILKLNWLITCALTPPR